MWFGDMSSASGLQVGSLEADCFSWICTMVRALLTHSKSSLELLNTLIAKNVMNALMIACSAIYNLMNKGSSDDKTF